MVPGKGLEPLRLTVNGQIGDNPTTAGGRFVIGGAQLCVTGILDDSATP